MTTTYKPHTELLDLRKRDAKFFDDWAIALETTELKQAKEAMSDCSNSACCLQVLEISKGNEQLEGSDPRECGTPRDLYENPTIVSELLPEDIKVAICNTGFTCRPMDLNDDEGLSFKQIAQLLRGNEVIHDL